MPSGKVRDGIIKKFHQKINKTLLACPACKGIAQLKGGPYAQEPYSISCTTCGHSLSTGFDGEKLAEAWNQKAKQMNGGWQPAQSAPKGDVIIGCFDNYPLPVCCAWNEPEQQWTIANMQVNLFRGKWNDTYFESEYECSDALKAWMPLPKAA